MIKRIPFTMLCLSLFISQLQAQFDSVSWNRAIAYTQSKDYLSALMIYDEISKNTPSIPETYYNRGVLHFRMGNIDQACIDMRTAADLNMKNASVPDMCYKDKTLKSLADFFYPGVTLDSSLGYRPLYTMKDTLRGALRRERNCFDVKFYDLSVRIIPSGKKIKGSNRIVFDIIEPTTTIQIDLFANMKIDSIVWKNQKLNYTRQYDAVFISFPQTLLKGSQEEIEFYYKGSPVIAPKPPWQGGFVWERTGFRNHWVSVACEHLGASSWWPNKDHLSDEPDSMQINFEVPQKYDLISNGNLRSITNVKGGYRRHCWFVNYPINNYNVSFYMGHYVNYSDTVNDGNKIVNMQYYVLPENLEIAKTHFKHSCEVVKTYNRLYGTFPFIDNKFALVESPFAGMEHQSAIAYGNGYGKSGRGYNDKKYDPLVVHEGAHEWWGNSVSARDMADLWIHESFATYSELLFLEEKLGYEEGYLSHLRIMRNQISNFWPMVHHYDVNEYSFAGNDIYMKGAALLDNLRCCMNNDSAFFALLYHLHTHFQRQIIGTKEMIDEVNSFTGKNYRPLFNKFLYDVKLPLLEYSTVKDGNDLLLTCYWTGVEKGFSLPFCIRYDNNQKMRIEASDIPQTIRISNTSTLNFFTQWVGYVGCLKNCYTYFYTQKI